MGRFFCYFTYQICFPISSDLFLPRAISAQISKVMVKNEFSWLLVFVLCKVYHSMNTSKVPVRVILDVR